MKDLHRLVFGMLVATLTQTCVAAAQATCDDGSAPGNRITFARKNDKTCSGESMQCDVNRDDTGADQPQGYGAITVDGASKTYIASSLTITEGMVFYIGTDGIEAEPKPPSSTCTATKQRGPVFSPPFCAGANVDDIDSSCECWCPPTHGRENETGPCIPVGNLPTLLPATTTPLREKAVGTGSDGKTNVGNGDDAGESNDDENGGDTDGDPPETSKSSVAVIVGVLVPLVILSGIVGYVIAMRKQDQGRQPGFAETRGPPAKNNPVFTQDGGDVDDANYDGIENGDVNAYEQPVSSQQQQQQRQPSDDGTYEMPDPRSITITGASRTVSNATYDEASPSTAAGGAEQASYSMASATGQTMHDEASSSAAAAMYDEASPSAASAAGGEQASYSMASATGQATYTLAGTQAAADDAGLEL